MEDYLQIQNDKHLPTHKFLKHCSSRWLTLNNATERIIEEWDGLRKYFLIFVPKNQNGLVKTIKYKKINDCLRCTIFRTGLEFVLWSTSIFQRFYMYFPVSGTTHTYFAQRIKSTCMCDCRLRV